MANCEEEHKLRMTTSVLPENAKCSACTRTFSDSGEALHYTCTDCDVIIHRKCAELPKQINHPMHPQHPLLLFAKPPYELKACDCQACQESWENSVYHCSSCEFDIDILCVMSEDEVVRIPTHHHPVRLIRRPARFLCNACGVLNYDNESYTCTEPSCGFWIHKECGLSQETFKCLDHDHPLLLATSVPVQYLKYKFTCEDCKAYIKHGSNVWVYYCQRCKYFIHLKCITNNFSTQWRFLDLKSIRPRWAMIRQLSTIMVDIGSNLLQEEGSLLPEVKVDSHEHSLVLNSDHNEEDEDETICDGCIQPITSPYYKCGQYCDYFLHTTCTTLPRRHEVGDGKVSLHFPEKQWEAVKCLACQSFCNGFTYWFVQKDRSFYLDIKCYYLQESISHIGHKHPLRFNYSYFFTCGGCGDICYHSHHFRCEPCRFSLGIECAMLPATVKHRWDKHQLVLSFPPHIRDTDAGEEFYCEVCEEEIHPKHWMYRCVECDRSFHPRCIPTLGESRNIKFGKKVSVKTHPHPLTLVPQAKLTSRCHTCRKSLHWSRCFECADCGFYLCPDCIPKQEL